MDKNKPKPFFCYPQREEDLIIFDIPKNEKLLEQKFAVLREEVFLRLKSVTYDDIMNEILRTHKLGREWATKVFGAKTDLAFIANQTFLKTREAIYQNLMEFLEEGKH